MPRSCAFETPAGFCAIAWSDWGATRFVLPGASAAAAEKSLKRRVPESRTGRAAGGDRRGDGAG